MKCACTSLFNINTSKYHHLTCIYVQLISFDWNKIQYCTYSSSQVSVECTLPSLATDQPQETSGLLLGFPTPEQEYQHTTSISMLVKKTTSRRYRLGFLIYTVTRATTFTVATRHSHLTAKETMLEIYRAGGVGWVGIPMLCVNRYHYPPPLGTAWFGDSKENSPSLSPSPTSHTSPYQKLEVINLSLPRCLSLSLCVYFSFCISLCLSLSLI